MGEQGEKTILIKQRLEIMDTVVVFERMYSTGSFHFVFFVLYSLLYTLISFGLFFPSYSLLSLVYIYTYIMKNPSIYDAHVNGFILSRNSSRS